MTESAPPEIVLISGASHVGKTTLAAALTNRLGWRPMSTDRLGRHPGRPWQIVRDNAARIASYYLSMSGEELARDVLRYQREMWVTIERIIKHHLDTETSDQLVFEGSALLPDQTGAFDRRRVSALCLVASEEFLRQRIFEASGYEDASDHDRALIVKFVERNRLLNAHYEELATENGVRLVDVGNGVTVEELVEIALAPMAST